VPFVAAGCTLHGITVNPAGILRAGGGENDLIAVEFAVDLYAVVSGLERPGKILKDLFERQLALAERPYAFDLGRDDPKMSRAP